MCGDVLLALFYGSNGAKLGVISYFQRVMDILKAPRGHGSGVEERQQPWLLRRCRTRS